jgi:arylsulfatase A-like enzyme
MIADDHRRDAFGFMGDPDVRTPRFDQLARRGVSFGNAYIHGGFTAAVCAPSRACMMTGTDAFTANACHDIDAFPHVLAIREGLPLLPEILGRAGYHTHCVGKWHNDPASLHRGFHSGGRIFMGGMDDHRSTHVHAFDRSSSYRPGDACVAEGFSTEVFAGDAIRFIQERAGDERPFFLYVAFTAPHDPFVPPEAFRRLYDPAAISLPPNFLERHPFDQGDFRIRFEDAVSWPRDPDAIRELRAAYYGMISHLDHQAGRIIDTLDEQGTLEDTIVVYTSDHGLSVGSHGILGKGCLYDHSAAVNCILAGPGIPEGIRSHAPVHANDLYPTLCDLASVPTPETVTARSLVPVFTGAGRASPHEAVFSIYKHYQRMVREGAWKLIRYYRDEQRGEGSERVHLFNLDDDPHEMCDLADRPRHRKRLRGMLGRLHQWQVSVCDPLAVHGAAPRTTGAAGGRTTTHG